MAGMVRKRATRLVAAVAASAVVCWGLLAGASAGAAVTRGTGAAGAHAAANAGTWGTAEQVPGLVALSTGPTEVSLESCPSAGNCTMGGGYFDSSSGNTEAFVASEVNGTWGNAQEVPSIATLNAGFAQVNVVSCASAGNCSGAGTYDSHSSGAPQEIFVVDEVNGSWGNAAALPGLATLNTGGDAWINSISCGSAGNCVVAGDYQDGSNVFPFTADEVNGTWATAEEVPGIATLSPSGGDDATAVSCASAGNCTLGGSYTDGSSNSHAFLASEVNGAWGTATAVPGASGTAYAGIGSVSCPSVGNCAAAGGYSDNWSTDQVFVLSEVNGVWGSVQQVPGLAGLNTGSAAGIGSVSCPSAGNCTIGGNYTDSSGHMQAFVASEANGAWGKALEVPGAAALNAGGFAAVSSVSCAAAGNCGVGGSYSDSSGHGQAFVASEVNGAWGKALEVPGTAALNVGGNGPTGRANAGVTSASCSSAADCGADGWYTDSSGRNQAFVVSETPVAPLAVTTTSLPSGTAGSAYTATLAANGGTLPYTWSLAAGSSKLPAGLSLAPDGTISGTPTSAGTTAITVQVSDSGAPQQAAAQALSVTVGTPAAQPDLNISLHPKGVFRHGRNATYRVRVVNAGNASASHEKVVVHLPSGMTRPAGQGTGWVCRHRGSREICVHRGGLQPGQPVTFYLRIHITARKGSKLTTAATVTPAGSDTNNTATSTVRIR